MSDSSFLDARARAAGFKSYSEYISSSHWRHVRATNLKRSCFVCHKKNDLQLHHLTYATMGCERPEDLVTLCPRCHRAAHGQSKKPGSNLKTAHFEVRPAKDTKRAGEGRFVHWMKLINKSKKETISQLQEYMVSQELLGEDRQPTQKARDLQLALEIDGKTRWSLEQFIRYRSLQKNGRTLKNIPAPRRQVTTSVCDKINNLPVS